MAGSGSPLPGPGIEAVSDLWRATRSALKVVREVEDLFVDARGLLVQACAVEPGARALVTAAADTLRITADKLDALNRRPSGTTADAAADEAAEDAAADESGLRE
ncbi:MAG: hypothetical protein ACRDSK_06475 [Actinophytocola sp.]|uniref:hypothetical protein n=1 Tax=Actinophytocola sp. TaxID=1872138 RepID=UPI003D6AD9AE